MSVMEEVAISIRQSGSSIQLRYYQKNIINESRSVND